MQTMHTPNVVHHQNLESTQPVPPALQTLKMHLIEKCAISTCAWVVAILTNNWSLIHIVRVWLSLCGTLNS